MSFSINIKHKEERNKIYDNKKQDNEKGCGPSALEKEPHEAEMKRADLLAQDLRNMGYDDEDIFSDSDFSSSEDEEQPEEEEVVVGERWRYTAAAAVFTLHDKPKPKLMLRRK